MLHITPPQSARGPLPIRGSLSKSFAVRFEVSGLWRCRVETLTYRREHRGSSILRFIQTCGSTEKGTGESVASRPKRKVFIIRVPGTSRVTDALIHAGSVNLLIARGLPRPVGTSRLLRANARTVEIASVIGSVIRSINHVAGAEDLNDCVTSSFPLIALHDSPCSICRPPAFCNPREIRRK